MVTKNSFITINKKEKEELEKLGALSEAVSKGVFDTELKNVKDELEKQATRSDNITIGVVVASILILVVTVVTLVWDSHKFMAEYNQHYLDTQNKFTEEVSDLRKENSDIKEMLLREMDKTTDRQDYLERTILEKATTKLK